jgi:hypothetical protein
VNVVSVFTMRLPACILVLECQLRVKRSRCVKSDFATDLNNCDPRAFESPCQLLCVCVCMLNTWTWHAGQVRMSSAIGKQVNDSIAKDKQGDKQGLGEQNPCEVCSKGCTCADNCSCGSDCTCKSCAGAQSKASVHKSNETSKAKGK